MNIDHVQASDWLHEYKKADGKYAVDAAVLPPFTSLYTISSLARTMGLTHLSFGAQTVSDTDNGAFTGDISASMLSALDCRYVLIGHSEQRRYHPEDDDRISSKIHAVLHAGMTPIICIGESMRERENNPGIAYPLSQLSEALQGITSHDMDNIIIAYEPVFSIGSGTVMRDIDIECAIRDIRMFIAAVYGDEPSEHARILYGGSVNSDNADSLIRLHDVDGFLVGGASLKPSDFIGIMSTISSSLPYKMHAPISESYGNLRGYPQYRSTAQRLLSHMRTPETMMTSLALAAYRTVGFGEIMSIAEEYIDEAADASGTIIRHMPNMLHDTIMTLSPTITENMIYEILRHKVDGVVSVEQWGIMHNDDLDHDEKCSNLLQEYKHHSAKTAYEHYHGMVDEQDFLDIFGMGYLSCNEDAKDRHWRKRGIDDIIP